MSGTYPNPNPYNAEIFITKTFMTISNWEKKTFRLVYTKICQRFKGTPEDTTIIGELKLRRGFWSGQVKPWPPKHWQSPCIILVPPSKEIIIKTDYFVTMYIFS